MTRRKDRNYQRNSGQKQRYANFIMSKDTKLC